jgi:hypothetical protein
MKYTLNDYKNDLMIFDWIEKNTLEDDYEINENRLERGERIILVNDNWEGVDYSENRTSLILKNISDQDSLTFSNIQLLKRSYFNLDKFRSLLKVEEVLDDEDDFSGPLILLWTQLENFLYS